MQFILVQVKYLVLDSSTKTTMMVVMMLASTCEHFIKFEMWTYRKAVKYKDVHMFV